MRLASGARPVTRAAGLVAIAVGISGCLPSSRRGTTDTLLPADSLSRQIAARVAVDSLVGVWRSTGEPMQLPTSIEWLDGGTLVVSDTRAGALRLFDDGSGAPTALRGTAAPLAYPYLAGSIGDSVAVLLRGDDRLVWVRVADGATRVLGGVAVPEGATAALATPAAIWVKRADENESWLVHLDTDGGLVARHPLPGPSWRRIGFLRRWGDGMVSLSGYRPVVDVLQPAAPAGSTPDSLALVGFDSPQLLRSHRYIRGEVDQPPLLTSSAVALGDSLYVVNLRTDHLRIDVFDRAGRLQRILVHQGGGAGDHFPVDIAARRDEAGSSTSPTSTAPGAGRAGVLFALVMQRPGGVLSEPGGYVQMLRWSGEGN